MFERYKLHRQYKKVRNLKIHAVREKSFESAASYRDQEKEILKQITLLKKKQRSFWIKKLLYIVVKHYSFNGFYVQPSKKQIPVRIDLYPFATWLNIYLESSIAESSEMSCHWENHSLYHQANSNDLIKQASEYFIILFICQNLSSVYEKYSVTRSNIEDLLETNALFRLFTLHPQHRKNFNNFQELPNVKTYFAKDEKGNINGLYERFEYLFSYPCTFKRINKAVQFSTPYFNLHITVNHPNLVYPLPLDYARYYLGFKRNSGRRVSAQFILFFKWRIGLPWNWKYINQTKALIDEIKEAFCGDHYFKNLDWENKRVLGRIISNICDKK